MTDIYKGTYMYHVGNYDWGAAVDRAVLTFAEIVPELKVEALSVKERKLAGDKSKPDRDLYEVISDRKVEAIYYCDEDGNAVEAPSKHVAVDLYVSPEEGSPFACTTKREVFVWSKIYELLFCYNGEVQLDIDSIATGKVTAADMFAKQSYVTSAGIRYDYAEYVPEQKTDTLFVWMHGLGEGCHEDSDVYLPLLGRRGTSMAGKQFQDTIGGAVVIAPQCPTYWMDADGMATNLNNCRIAADGTSYYTDSLEEFIDAYAKKMEAGKIVLAGCSNGGYMALMLAFQAPEKYDAIIPICEPVPDDRISDDKIQKLVDLPMYFVYSTDDPIVEPEIHEIPTIARLKKAGCKDLHVSVTDQVIDTSGRYKTEDGEPYRYMGHLSWIYYDNDETDDGTGLSAWNWLKQVLDR